MRAYTGGVRGECIYVAFAGGGYMDAPSALKVTKRTMTATHNYIMKHSNLLLISAR